MHPDQVILGKVVVLLFAMQHMQYRTLGKAAAIYSETSIFS